MDCQCLHFKNMDVQNVYSIIYEFLCTSTRFASTREHDACDQFSVVYEQGDKVGVYLNTQPEPSLLEERPVSIY